MQSDANESFADFLRRYGDRFPPSFRFQPGREDARHWQERFLRAVCGLRGPLPERAELQVRVLEESPLPDHTRYLLRYAVNPFSTAYAYLLVPTGIREGEKRPGVVALHGHVPKGIEAICGVSEPQSAEDAARAYGLWAVRAGYVVLSPAWWGWPGRDAHLARVGNRDRCNVIQMAAHMYGLHILDLHIQDGQAAVDVLQSRPEVDAERIGCIGNSYGGRMAMWLGIFEPRIKACVSAGAMNTFRERSLKLASCAIQYFPGILKYGDVPELYGLIAPRALQLQAGEEDPLITPEDRDHIHRSVRAVYREFGATEQFDCVLHPGGHLLIWELAEAFLCRHLEFQRFHRP